MSKVSVIIATHNRVGLLKRAIDSVLNQTFKDFELIIVDDNSKDGTKELVESYDDNRITYIFNENNPAKTHCRPLNVGILRSRGEYITYLDDDNEYYPYKLEISVKALDKEKDIDAVYCDMLIEDKEGNTQHGIALDFDAQFLLRRNYIDTSVVMHRRQAIFDVGGWDEKVKRFTDWNLWARMTRWGHKFKRIPIIALKYYAHGGDTQSSRTPVRSWFDPLTQMTMFEPPFDPVGDYIFRPYLGKNRRETAPKVAIFTLTYDRLDYTKRMFQSMSESTKYPFDWFVVDNGSKDDTPNWLADQEHFVFLSKKNLGITGGSNKALEMITEEGGYDIIIKVDNDCEFMTKGWLETLIDIWRRNHNLYMSPYPEGLVSHPGGAPRVGYGTVGPYMIEVTQHIGGFFAMVDARAYKKFRWEDQFVHGNQDTEASLAFRKMGYMPCYIPLHRVMHMDTTEGQHEKYKEYFRRRVLEKQETWKEDEDA